MNLKKKNNILKLSIMQGLGTLISRCSGLIRDIITANHLGASSGSDSFFIAFKLPNTIRKIIGEGPLSAVFVPIFIKRKNQNTEDAKILSGTVAIILFLITLTLTILGEIFMPELIALIAPGITKPETITTIISLSRISAPFMIMTTFTALLGGIANGLGKFFAFGFTPVILNFAMTLSLLIGSRFINIPPNFALTYGIFIGGLCQSMFMIIVCKKLDYLPLIRKKISNSVKKDLRQFFKNISPILFGQSVFQLNMFVDDIFASMQEKVPSYLYYSNRMSQFIVSIIGHTLGVVVLSKLAKYMAKKQHAKAEATYKQAISICILLTLPASFGLFSIADLLIRLVYERGSFLASDTYYVVNMLKITCISIPFISLNKIQYSSLYSNQNYKPAVRIGIFIVLVNLILNISLYKVIDTYYVSIATTTSCILEFFIVKIYLIRKSPKYTIRKKEIILLLKCLAASIIMYIISDNINKNLNTGDMIKLTINVSFSAALYLLLILTSKTISKKDLS